MAGTTVEQLDELSGNDLSDLCDATEAAIGAGGGFGWLTPPARQVLEAYWRGVLLVPERTLFVARLDGVIGGSAQLVRPSRNNEAQAVSANLTTSFMAPWARGHGLAKQLTEIVESVARAAGFTLLNLDVRDTQEAAVALYNRLGYTHWATHPYYAFNGKKWVSGLYFYKHLNGPEAK
jgi:ribosomal protein S18 acetylase RimI-like enzyme